MASTDRNRVLSITMKIIDGMSPALKVARMALNATKAVGIAVFKAMTLPVRLFGASIKAILSPIGLLRSALAFMAARGLFQFFTAAGEAGDQLAKLSARTGIAAKDLSVLRYAAELADADLGTLATGFKNLSKSALAAKDTNSAQAKSFALTGVNALDANGKIRPLIDTFGELADWFSKLEDGGYKSGVAVKLFGKSGDELIPMLNELGRKGFKGAAAELEKFGGIITDVEANQAEEFMDSLTRMKFATQGLRNAIAFELFPILTDLFNNWAAWIGSNRTDLKQWAADAAATVKFVAGSVAAFVKLIKGLAGDPSSAKALGEVFQHLATGYIGAMREAFIAGFLVISNIIQVMSRPILRAAQIIGTEVGKRIREGLLSPFINSGEEEIQAIRLRMGELERRAREDFPGGLVSMPAVNQEGFLRSMMELEAQIVEIQKRLDAPIKSVQQEIGEGFQAIVRDIATDTGDMAQAVKDGKTKVAAELKAMVDAIGESGKQLVFTGQLITQSGIPFFEYSENQKILAFKNRIAELRKELEATKEVIATTGTGLPSSLPPTPPRTGPDPESIYTDEQIASDLEAQERFYVMMADGREAAIRQEEVSYAESLRQLRQSLADRNVTLATYYQGEEALAAEHNRKMEELDGSFTDGMKRQVKDWREEMSNEFSQGRQFMQDTMQSIEGFGADWAESWVDDTKKVSEAWKNLGREIIRIIGQIVARQAAMAAVSLIFGGGGFNAAAMGQVYRSGEIMKFAKGGLFKGPTVFPVTNGGKPGLGVAGEAGYEAAVPLTKDRRGRLGINATGIGGGDQIAVTFEIHTNDAKGFDRLLAERQSTFEGMLVKALKTRRTVREAVKGI